MNYGSGLSFIQEHLIPSPEPRPVSKATSKQLLEEEISVDYYCYSPL